MSAEFDLAFDRWVSALADAAARRDTTSAPRVEAPRLASGTIAPPVRESAPAPVTTDADDADR